jgi:glycosyltransferase involved in cell wall biosynthesis
MKKTKKPLISILVAVYNLEAYIEQCLDSILSQSFEDYELILVDNGSTDRSIEICQSYADSYPNRVKYIKFGLPTVIGRPYAYGLENMQGRYFMSVDGDDYLVPEALQRLADIIKTKKTDIIMGTFLCDMEEGMTNFMDADFDENKINNVPYDDAIGYIADLPNFHTVQWRFILKKELIRELLIPRKMEGAIYSNITSRFNDTISVIGFLAEAKSIYFMKTPFYIYRRRKSSLSSETIYDRLSLDFLKCFTILLKLFGDKKSNMSVEKYIIKQIIVKFELFRLSCNTINCKDYMILSETLHYYINSILISREYTEETECFCNFLYQYGIFDGLVLFTQFEKLRLYKIVNTLPDRDYYVFPTGLCGESTCLMLEEYGVTVKGFLDNDETKVEHCFLNKPCMLPKYLNDKKAVVVIATAYSELKSTLYQQMKEIGIPEKYIIIR